VLLALGVPGKVVHKQIVYPLVLDAQIYRGEIMIKKIFTLLMIVLFSGNVLGLTYNGHDAMVKHAFEIVKETERRFLDDELELVQPAGAQHWDEFLQIVAQISTNFGHLKANLPSPYYSWLDYTTDWDAIERDIEEYRRSLCHSNDLYCNSDHINEKVEEYSNYLYEKEWAYINRVEEARLEARGCGYEFSQYNFSNFEDVRFNDLVYCPEKRHIPTAGSPCSYELKDTSEENKDYHCLPSVLGRASGKVDDIKDEVHAGAELGQFLENIGKAVALFPFVSSGDIVTTLTVALIFCIGNLFRGRGCPIFTGKSTDKTSPLNKPLIPALPPVLSKENSDLKGMFHMVHMDREGIPADKEGAGEYNKIPGAQFWYSGPNIEPGYVDTALAMLTDIAGGLIDARKSNAVKNYGKFDENRRGKIEWQSVYLAHLEFSPGFNLAMYGWELFLNEPDNSKGLAWPLHMIGDLTVPHHLVATSCWGHKGYEDAVWALVEETNTFMTDEHKIKVPNDQTTLEKAYYWWSNYCHQSNLDEEQLKEMLIALAKENRTEINNSSNPMWPFNQDASFGLGEKEKELQYVYLDELSSSGDGALFSQRVRSLWDGGVSATLAFLACASPYVDKSITEPQPHTLCQDGTYYSAQYLECIWGIPEITDLEDIDVPLPMSETVDDTVDTDSELDTDTETEIPA
jgi:hypothetical protein